MQHPKGILIERCKQLGLGKPGFRTRNTGPEHEPIFESVVTVRGEVYGTGRASTKRDAERQASEAALAALQGAQRASPASRSERPAEPDTSYADEVEGADDEDEPFRGPWPIFAEVLAASLSVAHARVNPTLTGPGAITEVQALALQLYKGTLESLGEVVELEDDPEADTRTDLEADPEGDFGEGETA
jgi:hypothetical protein